MFDAKQTENRFHPLAKRLEEQLKAELLSQQHKSTGRLIGSIHVEVENFIDEISIVGYAEFYGQFVDRGRKPGTKRVPIDALIEWIKVKGFESDERRIRQMAFAVQAKTFKDGNRIFRDQAKFGNFVGKVLQSNKSEIQSLIEKNFNQLVLDYVHSTSEAV